MSKSCCSLARLRRPTDMRKLNLGFALLMAVSCAAVSPRASANDAPQWMHALVNRPLPEHDEKSDAGRLHSDYTLTVQPNGKIKSFERQAYKILRVGGKEYGTVRVYFDAETKI